MSYFNFSYRNHAGKTISVTSRGKVLGEVIDDFAAFLKACGFKMDNLELVLNSTLDMTEACEKEAQPELPIGGTYDQT